MIEACIPKAFETAEIRVDLQAINCRSEHRGMN